MIEFNNFKYDLENILEEGSGWSETHSFHLEPDTGFLHIEELSEESGEVVDSRDFKLVPVE